MWLCGVLVNVRDKSELTINFSFVLCVVLGCGGGVEEQFCHSALDALCGRTVDFFHKYKVPAGDDLLALVSQCQAFFVSALNGSMTKDQVGVGQAYSQSALARLLWC